MGQLVASPVTVPSPLGVLPRNLPHRAAFSGLELLRVFSVTQHLTPATASARPGDLQKPANAGNAGNADGNADRAPLRASNEAYSRSDLQLYVVAGVGFEPT